MNVDLGAVRRILQGSGVHLRQPRLLAAGRSIVIADGTNVIKISPEHQSREDDALRTAQRLATLRAPVAEPASLRSVATMIGTVTFWPLLTASQQPLTDLGIALGELHQVPSVGFSGRNDRRERIFAAVRLLPSRGLPAGIVAGLDDLARQLPERAGWADDDAVVVHGDAHSGNVMRASDRPILIDTGDVHTAPWQLDLVPVWCQARRNDGDWAGWYELRDAYGSGLTNGLWDWPHLAEAVLERELVTTLFLAEQWNLRPWVRLEIEKRLDTWHTVDAAWNTG